MNNNQSPMWDKDVLTRIGILTLTLIIIFIITNILNSINTKSFSKIQAEGTIVTKKIATTKSQIANVITEEEIKIEQPKASSYYIPTEVILAKEEERYKKWIESESYLPDFVKQQKIKVEEAEKLREEEEQEQIVASFNEVVVEDSIATEESIATETNASEESSDDSSTYYGTFQLTAYTWTGNPCADGAYPSSGYTVACNDPGLWHKWIYIEGYGNYYVHDTGGMGGGVIDVYMDSYDACIQFGRRSANIYVLN